MIGTDKSGSESVIAQMGVSEEQIEEAFGSPQEPSINGTMNTEFAKALYAEERVPVMLSGDAGEIVGINGVYTTIQPEAMVMVPLSVAGVLQNQREGMREVKRKNDKLSRLTSYNSINQVREYIR